MDFANKRALIKERASNPRPDNSIWGDRIVRYDYVDEVEEEDDDDEDEVEDEDDEDEDDGRDPGDADGRDDEGDD